MLAFCGGLNGMSSINLSIHLCALHVCLDRFRGCGLAGRSRSRWQATLNHWTESGTPLVELEEGLQKLIGVFEPQSSVRRAPLLLGVSSVLYAYHCQSLAGGCPALVQPQRRRQILTDSEYRGDEFRQIVGIAAET